MNYNMTADLVFVLSTLLVVRSNYIRTAIRCDFNTNNYLYGFIFALYAIIQAINWNVASTVHNSYGIYEEIDPGIDVLRTAHVPPAAIIPPVAMPKKKAKVLDNLIIETVDLSNEPKDTLSINVSAEDAFEHAYAISNKSEVTLLPPPIEEEEPPIVKYAEHMPVFPLCANKNLSAAEKKECTGMKIQEIIHANLKYPQIALENDIHGTVVIGWYVDTNGQMKDLAIIRDLGAGTGKAALDVIKTLPQYGLWNPGRHRGRTVKVQYYMPVKFKLE